MVRWLHNAEHLLVSSDISRTVFVPSLFPEISQKSRLNQNFSVYLIFSCKSKCQDIPLSWTRGSYSSCTRQAT